MVKKVSLFILGLCLVWGNFVFSQAGLNSGQTKILNEDRGSANMNHQVQPAVAYIVKGLMNNRVARKAGLDDSFGISQNQDLQMDSPLATRTASVSGNWSSTATWGGQLFRLLQMP